MRLKSVKAQGLFGLFDHIVDLRLDDRITIIHAPNGYGKTVILKLIAGFFGGSLAIFREYKFTRLLFEFDDSSSISIDGSDVSRTDFFDSELQRTYTISRFLKKKLIGTWNPDEPTRQDNTVPPSILERYIPNLRRIGPRKYRDRSGVAMSYEEALERYWSQLPPNIR